MDPLSFTASLMTVSGVTIMASKLIYTLREKMENAPKDVGDLLEQLQTFQELLDELKTQLQDSRDNTATQSKLLQIWGQSVAHMQRDVTSLHTKLSKLEQMIKKKSLGSRVLLSARQMLSEKKVVEYQRKIESHCGVLTCIKATVCDQKLSRLTQNTIQLGNDNNAGFQTISSQVSQATGHLEAQARAGFSNVSSELMSAKSASDEMHRDLQSRMDDHAEREDIVLQNVDEMRCNQMRAIEINEEGFQAVQSALVTAVSSNREGHESTHAMLRRQETLMQRLGNRLASGYSNNCASLPRIRSNSQSSTTSMITVYWKSLYHRLPIGKLHISIHQTRRCRSSEGSASSESMESNIEVTFVPPKWLTCLAIEYRMKLDYNSIGDQWHGGASLRPLTVNQNPFVIQALRMLDLRAIRKSFREGLIHPTDHVLLWSTIVMPWYWMLDRWRILITNDAKVSSLLLYMGENGLPGQTDLLSQIEIRVRRSPIQSVTLSEDFLQHCVRIYLQHGGNLLTELWFLESLLFSCGQGGLKWISESCLQSTKGLTVDELPPFGICLLGILAQVNPEFRTRLKACLASYRSPLLAAGTSYADSLLESTFGIASVLSHFHRLDRWKSRKFLAVLCRTGIPSMLRPFIDAGVDLNDDDCYTNMLGNAAAGGNLDMVRTLMEKGANSALSLYSFIDNDWALSDELYRHLLGLLVENARPTSFALADYDALLTVIESSRALLSHPKAPEILFCRKVLSDELISYPCTQHSACNYMCVAIRNQLDSVVELLLQHGAYANTTSSWLMFSVECGAASCTEALIQHGADVSFVDEAGRSALELARSNMTAPHPRIFTHLSREPYDTVECEVTAEEDAKILAAVERAFELKAQSTKSLESQYLNQEGEAMPISIFKKALGSLLAYYQHPLLERHSRDRYHEIRNLWSLSFYEALRMRFFYVLSYVLLLAVGILAVIRGDKRVRMPSRSILSAVALLLLAYIWGSSLQTSLPLKLGSGRSVTTQDS